MLTVNLWKIEKGNEMGIKEYISCIKQIIFTKGKKFLVLKIIFPLWYRLHCLWPMNEEKVLLIAPGIDNKRLDHNFVCLYKALVKNEGFEVETCYQGQHVLSGLAYFNRCLHVIRKLAEAKYVFICEANNVIGSLPIRKDCIITQLWHGCGAFKKFGFSTVDLLFGGTREEKERYPYYGKEAYVTVSSPAVIWAYAEAMGIAEHKILPIGVSRTDVFFDKEFITKARIKLARLMPGVKDKKVILYAPTFRGKVRKAATPDLFSVAAFHERLSKEYVILIKHHPFVTHYPLIEKEYRDFARDVTEQMEIEELLCVTDICISDYSSLIYEFSLFEKPMLFFAFDLEEYFDWRGFYYDYHEMTPGPICKTNEEMLDFIVHIEDRFDRQVVQEFRETFMSACDGNSTRRILELVFSKLPASGRASYQERGKGL